MHMKILTRQRAVLFTRQHTPQAELFVIGNMGNISGSNFVQGICGAKNILREVKVESEKATNEKLKCNQTYTNFWNNDSSFE